MRVGSGDETNTYCPLKHWKQQKNAWEVFFWCLDSEVLQSPLLILCFEHPASLASFPDWEETGNEATVSIHQVYWCTAFIAGIRSYWMQFIGGSTIDLADKTSVSYSLRSLTDCIFSAVYLHLEGLLRCQWHVLSSSSFEARLNWFCWPLFHLKIKRRCYDNSRLETYTILRESEQASYVIRTEKSVTLFYLQR